MTEAFSQLPMIKCSSCGKSVGHLFDDYRNGILWLRKHHTDLITEDDSGKFLMDADDLEKEYDGDNFNMDIIGFLKTYYQYSQENKTSDLTYFAPEALVARALLLPRELTKDDLPWLNTKNLTHMDNVKLCCIRTLMCDNSSAPY